MMGEIAALLKEDAEVRQARRIADQRREAAAAARRHQGDLEFELGQAQVKRTRTEQNLYSGRIVNSRELQDLQAELESLKRRVGVLEDQVLRPCSSARRRMRRQRPWTRASQASRARSHSGRARSRPNWPGGRRRRAPDRTGACPARHPPQSSSSPTTTCANAGVGSPLPSFAVTPAAFCGTDLLRPTIQLSTVGRSLLRHLAAGSWYWDSLASPSNAETETRPERGVFLRKEGNQLRSIKRAGLLTQRQVYYTIIFRSWQ